MNHDHDQDYKPSILIVDDDKEVLTSFKIWLNGKGFRPLTALNSKEALKILDEETIEVALLDFRLGTENGLTVAKMLKEADENLKIIMITGYPSYDTAVESIKAGLFDYLSKGSSNEKILETIKKAIHARKKEIREKGKSLSGENILKFIVICKHSLIKERLGSFSVNYPDFKMIKTFTSLEDLKETEYVPYVDVAMVCATCCIETFENSFPFFNEFYQVLPRIKPVLFNEHFSESEKVSLIRIGVKGFFSVDIDSEKLDEAFSLIKKGEIWTSRRLLNLAIQSGPEYLEKYLVNMDAYGLSSREKDILKAMSVGLKNKEIADKLFISENTVKTHVNKIYKKFGVKNRTQAIRFALDKKIL